MFEAVWNQLQALLGLGLEIGHVNSGQMALRTIFVYASLLVIVRLGSKRFLGKGTVFDTILGIMIGSVVSRAINGSAPFFPTLLAGAILVGIHWLLAILAFHISWFGPLVKGNAVLLIKDGETRCQGMRQVSITHNGLAQALRMHSRSPDTSKVELAYLERDGTISVIPDRHEPRVLDVSVADGVQTVRIKLE
jgi:uncharacterized membrane protein YcaP (DUF421 family)